MSERTVQVYRVTHVAERVVEDDGIYEDSVDMLRDILGAARQGLLEFESTDHDFVALEFDAEGGMKIHVIQVEGLERLPPKDARLPDPVPPPPPPRRLEESSRRVPRRTTRKPRRSR